jgi:putative ABC transport system permease protein
VALYRPDGLDIVRTYPDGGHGSLEIRSAAPESELLQVALTSGRWLKADDIDAVVLNQTASLFFHNAKVGDTLRATVNGRAATFRLVGLTRQIMTPAAAYVTPSTFAESVGLPPRSTNAVRVVMDEHDATTIGAVTGKIEAALSARGIGVQALISETMLEGAVRGHIYIFIYALILMSVVMAVVGALGLTSSMGTSVVERTREFGIMRTVGARSITILRNVISEGVFVGLMSWGIAIVLSIPLSLGVGNLVGTMAFASPLPLILSPMALVIWLLVIVLGSIAATAYPAWQASRLTIRETLSYF